MHIFVKLVQTQLNRMLEPSEDSYFLLMTEVDEHSNLYKFRNGMTTMLLIFIGECVNLKFI